jgi:hypothetical protein
VGWAPALTGILLGQLVGVLQYHRNQLLHRVSGIFINAKEDAVPASGGLQGVLWEHGLISLHHRAVQLAAGAAHAESREHPWQRKGAASAFTV